MWEEKAKLENKKSERVVVTTISRQCSTVIVTEVPKMQQGVT